MKTRINFKLCTMIAVLTVAFSLSGFAKDGQPTITKIFDLNQPGKLNAVSSGGGVTVQTHDQPQVVIQAFVRKNGKVLAPSDRSLDKVLEDFDIDFSKSGFTITAIVKRKSRMNFWRNNVGISLTIIVPEEMSCDVSSSGGGLKISGVKGTHDFSSSGGVSAVIHGGDKLGLDLDLSSGRVNIELHNFSGTSEKDRVKGTMNGGGIPVYAHASGGNVNVSYED